VMARVSLFINRVQFLDQNWIANALNDENVVGEAAMHWPYLLVFYALVLLIVGYIAKELVAYMQKRGTPPPAA